MSEHFGKTSLGPMASRLKKHCEDEDLAAAIFIMHRMQHMAFNELMKRLVYGEEAKEEAPVAPS